MSDIEATPVQIEVCLDSVESALAAEAAGAHRVELCDNLAEGGTTPSAGMISRTRERCALGLQVMIRPRGGDFLYTEDECAIMLDDILVARERGADGVVIGLLLPDGRIDQERSARLIEAARPMNVTFHRAFDMTRDPFEALKALLALGVDRILTSGQRASVSEGLELIHELNEEAGEQLIILPGCGIDPENVETVLSTGVREIHVALNHQLASDMAYRNPWVFMGRDEEATEYLRTVTDEAAVRRIVEACRG